MWLHIAWKESREHVWKMIAVAAIALSVEGYLFVKFPGDGQNALSAAFCLIPGAFFIALAVAAGERTAGSLDFLRSLPTPLWKWAAVRLVAGALAILLPLALLMLLQLIVSLVHAKGFDLGAWAQSGAITGLPCLSVYFWTVAAGVNRSSELRAGLAAICLFVAWLALAIYASLLDFVPSLSRVCYLVVVFSPLGVVHLPDPTVPSKVTYYNEWEVYLAQFLALAGTTWWILHRYGRLSASDDRSRAATSAATLAPAALRPARRSPVGALIWKEYRESLPICLAGLAIIVVLLLPSVLDWLGTDVKPAGLKPGAPRAARGFPHATPVIFILGTVLALVLGVGGHAANLEPRVWQFWRSRPIAPTGWFWIKYFTGAGVLLTAFDGTATVIDLLAGGPSWLIQDPYWWWGPLQHLLAYSAAVWLVCQIRQPIYAGILAMAVVIAVMIMGDYPVDRPYLPWISFHQVANSARLLTASAPVIGAWLHTRYLPFAATMLALSSFFALMGWLAVRRVAVGGRA